jgi:hypothetical protein
MPLRGFRARVASNGFVEYGGRGSVEFDFDGALRPACGASGRILDPIRNPSLVELLNSMDRCCQTHLCQPWRLRKVPRLPQILLAFPPGEPPAFEDTPALRRLAALELGVSQERLGANGAALLDMLLRDVWESRLIHPDAPRNPTGAFLLNADLCTQPRGVLRVFEDFSSLLGVRSRNPARDVSPLQLPNPASGVLARFRVDCSRNFSQPLSDELIDELKRAMRAAIGTAAESFDDEEILDAITSPDRPLTSWRQVLPKLRVRLTSHFNEASTDDDLLRAARNPDDPLIASGACKFQVLQRRDELDGEASHFRPEDLGRRIEVDLSTEGRPLMRNRRTAPSVQVGSGSAFTT